MKLFTSTVVSALLLITNLAFAITYNFELTNNPNVIAINGQHYTITPINYEANTTNGQRIIHTANVEEGVCPLRLEVNGVLQPSTDIDSANIIQNTLTSTNDPLIYTSPFRLFIDQQAIDFNAKIRLDRQIPISFTG